jgi:hypothetical protein
LSINDIDKGRTWVSELRETLETIDVAILCVTRENMTAPWILFEAGALSKRGPARVTPYLLGLAPRELPPPLQQLNAAIADRDETKRMMSSINNALGDERLEPQELEKSFDKWWPEFEAEIKKIPASELPPPPAPSAADRMDDLVQRLERAVASAELSRHRKPADPIFNLHRDAAANLPTSEMGGKDRAHKAEIIRRLEAQESSLMNKISGLPIGNVPPDVVRKLANINEKLVRLRGVDKNQDSKH